MAEVQFPDPVPIGQDDNIFEVHVCSYCDYQTRRFTKYLTHLRYVHQIERGFSVTCGIDGCEKRYSIVESLVKHLTRNHKNRVDIRDGDFGLDNVMEVDDENDDGIHNGVGNLFQQVVEHNNDDNNGHNVPDEQIGFDYTRTLALFTLALREEKKIPANACSEIVNEIHELFRIHSVEVSKSMISILNRNGIDPNTIDGIDDILRSFTNISEACNRLNSQQKQNEYFGHKFEFVEPEEILLGHDVNGKAETYMYIPIKKLLQALLKHDDVFSEVINGHSSRDEKLADFCDGQAFKQHPIFSSETALQINLYYDDFQVVNPLGTKIKLYKLAAFYFVLGNLPPQYRSKLDIIQLLILCRSELLKQYGMYVVLDRLINDLMSLETDVITIANGGQNYEFLGILAFLCADNLAAHSLGGFFESFSALRSCRFCMLTKDERQSQFFDTSAKLRTKDGHANQVTTVLQFPDLGTVYGIKGDSPFNRLQQYHSIWGSPSDIAHDLFEGFVCDALQNIITYFVIQRYFNLSQLNNKLKTFPYADCDKANKPSLCSDELAKFKIKQTASQCWCLLRLLPFMVNEWVPRHDVCLLLLVDLLDIVDVICSPSILPGEVYLLIDSISHFMESYFAQFDEDRVTPKAHYLTHYGRQILYFGPLIHCWTLRFEGKHNYFKELAYRTKNRKNICKSLAYRHQYQQCLYHTSQCFLSGNNHQTTKASLFPVRLLNNAVQELLLPILGGNENVFQANSLTVNGVKYAHNSCVICGFEMDSFVFGCISSIFVIGGVEHLLLEDLANLEFRRELHAYVVSKCETFKLFRVSELLDYHPLGLYALPNSEYAVILKYKVST